MRKSVTAAVAAALAVAGAGAGARPAGGGASARADDARQPATYVGRSACAACHAEENELWTGSHHDLAMQEPDDRAVLGDFDGATHAHFGVTTTFSRRGDAFVVRTDGADGALADHAVRYTFGVAPLQQYLLQLPGGRLQALNVCWDARPRESGGQRWFHLHPNEPVPHTDPLHWTGPLQNWNHMCAECHSTNVRKNYDVESDTFRTTYSELDVSCESCHGPGSRHVTWARERERLGDRAPQLTAGSDLGLVVRLKEDPPARWIPDPTTGIARRDRPRESHVQIDTCARCHARRGTFSEDHVPGRPLAQTHRLALLDRDLYHADGQVLGEVFEHGSFVQSKMFAAGVTCTDCHDPHSLKVAGGNVTCTKCHSSEVFDTPDHHHHLPGTDAARCVSCHAPTTNFMVVHARHDHSFRVPRPDLTVAIGTPNACNGCHTDRSAQWAADAAESLWPDSTARGAHHATTLHAGRERAPGALEALVALGRDASAPAIVRATAVDLVGANAAPGDPRALAALTDATRDADPDVRAASARTAPSIAPDANALIRMLTPLLDDPVRLVRMDAARSLAVVPAAQLDESARSRRNAGLEEYRAAERYGLDRAESRLNLGSLALESGDPVTAEREFLKATQLNPRFAPAWVNLADVRRQLGREDAARQALESGLVHAPGDAALEHAMGLALVRAGNREEALERLRRAAVAAPDNAHYRYVYAVAVDSFGRRSEAVRLLEEAHERHPGDIEILQSLLMYALEAGAPESALAHATSLARLVPHDRQLQSLIAQLRAAMERP